MTECPPDESRAWKVYGPDLNGRFGGLQGMGGLEATILDADGTTTGVINDQFGNGVATVSGGTVTWNTTRVGAYGPLPGIVPQTLGDVTQLAAATAWRSRRIDPTGFYWLGARYYEPTSGRFLSADPMGHAASPSLYDYAGGDPVNRTDPDGRCASKLAQYLSDPLGNAGLLNDIYNDVQAINDFNSGPTSAMDRAMATGSLGMGLRDYQALAAQLGWNGFTAELSEYQQQYYGKMAAQILQLQAQGKDVSSLWQGVLSDVPGVVTDSRGLMAGDSADLARKSWLASINGTTLATGAVVGAVITGYTRHGLNQAISRDEVGVSPSAILDAVKYPIQTNPQGGGVVEYVGRDATVILNANGKVITTYATNSAGIRVVPDSGSKPGGP